MKTLNKLKNKLMKNKNFRNIYEKNQPLMDFIHDILELRYKKGWTQEDLAKAIGTTKNTISKIEKGEQNISYQTMQKLVNALNGKLFISAQGDRVIKLSEETMNILINISKCSGKSPMQIIEESIRKYKLK